jgi:glutamate-1-semialdehyde 2,1-aminomutase
MAPSTAFSRDEKTQPTTSLFGSLKLNTDGNPALAAVQERFVQQNPTSLKLHEEAVKSLPGGNTRSLLHTAPFPICLKSGKGYQVTDEDGHT